MQSEGMAEDERPLVAILTEKSCYLLMPHTRSHAPLTVLHPPG